MARLPKLTLKKRARALEIIAESGSARKAARELGISHQAIYQCKDKHEAFNLGFREAMFEYQAKLEEECDRRAVEGVNHPVIYEGRITDTYKDYSDTLLMFRLKKIDPTYRDGSKIELTGKDGGPIVTKSVDGFDWSHYAIILGSVRNGAGDATPDGVRESLYPPYADGKAGGFPEPSTS